MNIINELLDEKFVLKFFKKNILPKYSQFSSIKKIDIHPIKKNIWETTYHIVFRFTVFFIAEKDNREEKIEIYCSAHSEEKRKRFFNNLKFLESNSFASGNLISPKPLFYSHKFKGVFYEGIVGNNLYSFIKEHKNKDIKDLFFKTGSWLAKFHSIKVFDSNLKEEKIKDIVPGKKRALEKIKERVPEYYDICLKIYTELEKRENIYFKKNKKRFVVHGDAHPENVIRIDNQRIAMIDFADMSKGDCARDIGAFLEQIDYMMFVRNNYSKKFVEDVKNIFLDGYKQSVKFNLGDDFNFRIDTYRHLTSLRIILLYLLKHDVELEKANWLINKIKSQLLCQNSQK